jgi:hypothetical protein
VAFLAVPGNRALNLEAGRIIFGENSKENSLRWACILWLAGKIIFQVFLLSHLHYLSGVFLVFPTSETNGEIY